MLRDAAAINLCRLIYLPTKNELNYLQDLHTDVNVGTNEIIPLFDLKKGLSSLRSRTWLNATKENVYNMRMNYPADWRSANLELSLTLMSQLSSGFDIALHDLSHRREKLDILYINEANKPSQISLEAMLTHDCLFYSLLYTHYKQKRVQFRLGLNYRWVELDSAELIKLSHLFSRQRI